MERETESKIERRGRVVLLPSSYIQKKVKVKREKEKRRTSPIQRDKKRQKG